jgi:hypothetical protein
MASGQSLPFKIALGLSPFGLSGGSGTVNCVDFGFRQLIIPYLAKSKNRNSPDAVFKGHAQVQSGEAP